MSDPRVMIVGGRDRRRRGRPPAEEPGVRVSTWLPARQLDQVIRRANEEEITVSEFVRRVLTREVPSQ